MATISRKGRTIDPALPWWRLVTHACPYCGCGYRLGTDDPVTEHLVQYRGSADKAGMAVLGEANEYVQSACPGCGLLVVTTKPRRFYRGEWERT